MTKNRQRPDTGRVTKSTRIWLDLEDQLNAQLHSLAKRLGYSRDDAIRVAIEEFCRSRAGVEAPAAARQMNQCPDPLEQIERAGRLVGTIRDAAERHLND